MAQEEFKAEKEKAFSETTAQTIFNTLREIESDRPSYQNRWLWELLQNATDAAEPKGVNCTTQVR
jgi:hypothetical protein